MKMWRVYRQLLGGKYVFHSASRERSGSEIIAFMLSMGMAHYHKDYGKCTYAIEMRAPDGRTWRYIMPDPNTPEQTEQAEARLKALSPGELDERRREAGRRVSSYFSGETPKPSLNIERVMERFRQKLAEREESVQP